MFKYYRLIRVIRETSAVLREDCTWHLRINKRSGNVMILHWASFNQL